MLLIYLFGYLEKTKNRPTIRGKAIGLIQNRIIRALFVEKAITPRKNNTVKKIFFLLNLFLIRADNSGALNSIKNKDAHSRTKSTAGTLKEEKRKKYRFTFIRICRLFCNKNTPRQRAIIDTMKTRNLYTLKPFFIYITL